MSESSSSNGKLGRLSADAKGLVADTREWVDAKLRLFELEIQEKLDGFASRFIATAIVVFFAALALIFGLVSGALGLGKWWGSDSLGFLAVAGLLLVIAALIHLVSPRFVRGSLGVTEAGDDDANRLPEARQLPPALKNQNPTRTDA